MNASPRTPVTLISGPLGSGKTTLLRHLLENVPRKIAIVMNEFGEIGIDGRILQGQNVQIAELEGGCVCCSLLGEFEAAVDEILETAGPDWIVVETTGVAEPDALAFDIQESLPQLRLDGVVVVMDADAMLEFPEIGHTTRLQIDAADTILLNKIDLVPPERVVELSARLSELNARAEVLPTRRCRVDPDLLLGLAGERRIEPPRQRHQNEFETFVLRPGETLRREAFEEFADRLPPEVYRAKGFVRFEEGTCLFNFVAGRWDLEPFEETEPVLVFIGKGVKRKQEEIEGEFAICES